MFLSLRWSSSAKRLNSTLNSRTISLDASVSLNVSLLQVEFKCQALGSPPPAYTWVDKEGIDATEKEGKSEKLSLIRNLAIVFLSLQVFVGHEHD